MHDHRKLGRELELFDTDPLIGAGLPYLLPAGAAIRHALEEYIGEVERRAGYQHVYSPVLGKRELYEISGHWAHYRDGMYPPTDIGGEQVVLRPSLCPHHAVIYRPGAHSYRDLPLRMAELGGMYRSELSGVLGGLTRVRAIQLNDAHVFRTPNQVAAEAAAALGLIEQAYRALGIEPTRYRLSLPGRDGKYVGGREMWDRATGLLEQVLVSAGVPYEAEEDEAAFYGPKIDVQIADSAEREASLSTVQVDFYLPERFGLEYVGADGARHRPMMVHATLGTPLLVGLFWGAPLVAAEAEAGTTQFAWMQSVTRKRWLAVKIGWMLLAAAVWGGVISALVTWWVSPTNAEQLNQFDPGRFDIMGIVPVGYSLFAVALGVTAGALLRRTLPALAVTLAGFIVVRVAITLWLRSHYISAVTVTYNVLGGYTPKGAYWRLASGVIGPNGQQLPRPNNTLYVDGIPQASLPGACSNLAGPNGGNPTPACTRALSHFHAFLTYQPADRFWAFQGIETGIFLALTAALITVTAVTLLRRDA